MVDAGSEPMYEEKIRVPHPWGADQSVHIAQSDQHLLFMLLKV